MDGVFDALMRRRRSSPRSIPERSCLVRWRHRIGSPRRHTGRAVVGDAAKIVYLQALGQSDREANAPMPEDAHLPHSVADKALESVGVMILQEHGQAAHRRPGRQIPSRISENDRRHGNPKCLLPTDDVERLGTGTCHGSPSFIRGSTLKIMPSAKRMGQDSLSSNETSSSTAQGQPFFE